MKLFVSLALMFVAQAALADAEPVTIPARTIFWQTFNLAILFGGLFYYLRKPIKDYFSARKGEFVTAANKAQSARLDAEKEYLDIQHKIEHLEGTRAESLERAKAEAVEMRKQMIHEAEELAARIRAEASATAKIEIQRARQELQEHFVRDAVAAARTVLSKDISAQDHQKLQTEFSQSLQVVKP